MDYNEEKHKGMKLSKDVMSTLAFYLMIYGIFLYLHVAAFLYFIGKITFDQYTVTNQWIIGFLGIFSSGGMTAIVAQKILNKKKNEKSKDNSNNS